AARVGEQSSALRKQSLSKNFQMARFITSVRAGGTDVECDIDAVAGIQGIMPHSNILLAIGAATRLMNSVLSCRSPRSIWTASCSIAGFGWSLSFAFSSRNFSQVECWYF